MIIKIKDINNNITFELLIESNILINDLHKCIRKVHNQYLGNNGIDVIRINGSLHILLYFVSLDKYVEMNYGNKPLNFIIDEYNTISGEKKRLIFFLLNISIQLKIMQRNSIPVMIAVLLKWVKMDGMKYMNYAMYLTKKQENGKLNI